MLGSFGSFCRYATESEILSDITEEDLDLLSKTLVESGHARSSQYSQEASRQPADTFVLCMSDMALFRIHVAKITIQNQLTRIKRDANVAGRDAIQSRKNGMSQLEEVLANLDATEFRLERAEDDVHIARATCYVTEYMRIEWHDQYL
jgi:hypothetical protein